MSDTVLATVQASQPRRWMGIVMLAAVGIFVLYVAMATPPSAAFQIFLILTGIASLWTADKMRRATENTLELTETELRCSDGQLVAKVADIITVERGAFAFKPSNGFLITLKTPGARVWQPGLWWRMGRRVGIGGVTPGSQTKFMSEIISAQIAQRD